MTLAQKRRFQTTFFQRAGHNVDVLRQMAEDVPGVRFNIVDVDDRVVAFNRANLENCNFKTELAAVGERLADLFPSVLAEEYVSLYREVRSRGEPIRNRITSHRSDRSTDLSIVSVFPLRDGKGTLIGTAAFYRAATAQDLQHDWYGAIRRAVDHIDAHYAERLSLDALARISGMSPTTFRRVFAKIMQLSPGVYVNTIRVNHARTLLTTTSMKVLDIALACGFYDESHFCRIFRRLRNQTPTAYRKAHFSG